MIVAAYLIQRKMVKEDDDASTTLQNKLVPAVTPNSRNSMPESDAELGNPSIDGGRGSVDTSNRRSSVEKLNPLHEGDAVTNAHL